MDLLTVHETAAKLKLNPKTVRRYIASGRLPALRISRRVRIERATAEAHATPTAPGEATGLHDTMPIVTDLTAIRRLTDEEIAQQLEVIEEAQAFSNQILARRGGELLPELWPVIRESREEHSKELCYDPITIGG
ncbi:MAG: helix-turn-helix domain-containing protein [Dehalococcoidia bacterium]